MIVINWDFTNGEEKSYLEVLKEYEKDKTLGRIVYTNCLDFFSFDFECDVFVVKKDNRYVSKNEIQNHTKKEIRPTHDLRKMLVAGAFEFI